MKKEQPFEYRKSVKTLDRHVERILDYQGGRKQEEYLQKSRIGSIGCVSQEELKSIDPEKIRTVDKFVRFVTKRLTWYSANAEMNAHIVDLEKDSDRDAFEKTFKQQQAHHEAIHSMAVFAHNRDGSKLPSDFLKPTYLKIDPKDLWTSVESISEENMVNLWGRREFNKYRLLLEGTKNGADPQKAIEKISEYIAEGYSEPFHKITEWARSDEMKKLRESDETLWLLAIYEELEKISLRMAIISDGGKKKAPHEEVEQTLEGFTKAFEKSQENRPPEYLEVAREIYTRYRENPDNKEIWLDTFIKRIEPLKHRFEQEPVWGDEK